MRETVTDPKARSNEGFYESKTNHSSCCRVLFQCCTALAQMPDNYCSNTSSKNAAEFDDLIHSQMKAESRFGQSACKTIFPAGGSQSYGTFSR